MYGAILGDIIGSPYEFDRSGKTKDFPLFIEESRFTDDSVMTVAVAEALMDSRGKTEAEHKAALVASMQKWGRKYPNAGYGGKFIDWLYTDDPRPYNSWGNGSAMRASAAGWLYDTFEETRKVARWTAEVTHNHPEGIIGAECVATVIFLARTGKTKEEIREFVESAFGYDLSRTCDEIRPDYHFDVSCQGTVPQAVTAFLEGNCFTDVIRTAVSLGGDCDTLTCIAGSMAEAYYGVPVHLIRECNKRISKEMQDVVFRFERERSRMYISYQRENLRELKVSDELRKNGDPERVQQLAAWLHFAREYPGKKEEHEEAMRELRKAFAAGEICPKTEEELDVEYRYSDEPVFPVFWRRGKKSTEMGFRLGMLTEEDLEEE